MKNRFTLLSLLVIGVLCLSTTPLLSSSKFKAIGYYPTFMLDYYPPAKVNYSAWDVMIYFYTNPDSLTSPYLRVLTDAGDSVRFFGFDRYPLAVNKAKQVIDSVHAHGNKILLGISAITYYNPATAKHLSAIIADTNKVKKFVAGLAAFCRRWGYDGADFNWEYPNAADRPKQAYLFKKLREAFDTWNPKGILSLTGENLTSVPSNQNYDVQGINQYVDWMQVESGARVSGHGGSVSGNPDALYHPANCPSFDSFTYGDSVYQAVPQYVTVNGWKKAGVVQNKLSQFISGYCGIYGGIDGPCQPLSGVSYNIFSYATLMKTYYQPSRVVRDNTSRALYLSWSDASGKHLVEYEDSISIRDKVMMLKQRGFSAVTVYDIGSGYINSYDYPNYTGDREYFSKSIKAAVDDSSIVSPQGPSISLSASSTTVQVGTTVNLSTVTGSSTRYVVFYRDGAYMSTDSTSPFTASWTPGASGTVVVRATAFDASGNSGSSNALTITVSQPATPPPVPTNQAPANLAEIAPSSSVQFTWSASTGATSYHFQLSTDSTFVSVNSETDVTNRSLFASALASPAKYYWHVRAIGSGGSSAYSAATSFTTSTGPTSPPPAPWLIAPAAGASSQPTTSTFVWNKAQGASLYRLQIATDSLFVAKTLDDSTVTDSTKTVGGLSSLVSYFWRVDARNPIGWGPWSEVRQFTTKDDVAPSVVITDPSTSETLSDSATIVAVATDNVAIHGVKFYVDGMQLGVEDTTAPFETKWTTLAVANGRHYLTAIAKDKASNFSTSAAESITVYNATAVSDLSIFEEALVPSWANASWAGTYDFASTEESYSPPYSVKCATTAYGGLRLRSVSGGTTVNIDPSLYSRVELRVMSASTNLKLSVSLSNASGGTFPYVRYKNFPTNQWVTISCPMSMLNPGNLPIQLLTVQSNNPTGRLFYVDDIKLAAARPGGLAPIYGLQPDYDNDAPSQMELTSNFPNPFNPSTTIAFEIQEDADVSLKVYDMLGREVATLLNERLASGEYRSTWNPGEIAGGVYFCRLDATGIESGTHSTRMRKMLFVK